MTDWHPLAFLNTSIVTVPGTYEVREITPDEAYEITLSVASDGMTWPPFVSAVGHEATAAALSEIVKTEVTVNRIPFEQQPGQQAIVLKLRGRLPEGQILDRAVLEDIGYDLWLMTRTDGA